MSYTAQELNTRVELQRYTTTENDFGEVITTWHTYAQAFAKVEPLVGRELFTAAMHYDEVPMKVTMRWRGDLQRIDRLDIGGEFYDIESIQNIRFRNRELLLIVKRDPTQ